MTELDRLWKSITDRIQTEIPAYRFDIWIKTLEPLCVKDGRVVLQAPTAGNKAVVVQNYLSVLTGALAELHPSMSEIDIICPDELESYMAGNRQQAEEPPAPEPKKTREEPFYNDPGMFNKKYSFDNFVVGKSNQFVYAAARAFAEEPGARHNPLFIYGGVGLGKTHIMQAIGNHIRETKPSLKVLYVTSEKFINELIEAIRGGKERGNQEFRKRYRKIDVLMIDDIQFIANKTSTQEEIFHTFNDLHNANKQIIISSDKPPKDISPLEERLRSRFEWGLIADVQPPDLETRIAILQKKAQMEKYNVKDEVLAFIARKIDTNIREMEGLLSRVVFYASLEQKPVTLAVAEEALRDYIKDSTETLTADAIIETICKYYNVSREDLVGKKKNKEIVVPRQICIYMITETLPLPLATIGQLMGNRDHTTIIHSRDKISEEIKNNNKVKVMLQDIRDMIYHK